MGNEMPFQADVEPELTPEGGATPSDSLLFELENRCAALREELAALELRLRELRIAAELCPRCGGAGQVTVRGGLYGELHQRRCTCQVMEA